MASDTRASEGGCMGRFNRVLIMVVQKKINQTNKIKYLTNLTRKKVAITTTSIDSNGGQTDQFFIYTFCGMV